jgi:colanic acid/amylovoran biosynthesis glycosyltransferase
VLFLGSRSEEHVADLLHQADVFVAPSAVARDGQMDGIPVALMEAMAVGLALSGIPELVVHDHTGLLVPPGDPDALAEAITRLIHDPALANRLGSQGRAHVQHDFRLETQVALLRYLFEQVNQVPTLEQDQQRGSLRLDWEGSS